MKSLRGEINGLWAQTLELAKWKLITVAAVTVAGLGWGKVKPETETGILLLYSIGFLCTYIDLLIYRRLIMIHVISRYLRGYYGKDEELLEERIYEKWIKENRPKLVLSERWGHLISSFVFSVGPVFLALLRYEHCIDRRLIIPLLAVILNLFQFYVFSQGRARILE